VPRDEPEEYEPDDPGGYLGMVRWRRPYRPWYSDAEREAMEAAELRDAPDPEDMDDDEFDDDGETAEVRQLRRKYENDLNVVSLAGPLAEAYHLRCPIVDTLKVGGRSDFAHITDRMPKSWDALETLADGPPSKLRRLSWSPRPGR
jgi:hypothetical protein